MIIIPFQLWWGKFDPSYKPWQRKDNLQYIVPSNDTHKIMIKIYIFARNISFNENIAGKSVNGHY